MRYFSPMLMFLFLSVFLCVCMRLFRTGEQSSSVQSLSYLRFDSNNLRLSCHDITASSATQCIDFAAVRCASASGTVQSAGEPLYLINGIDVRSNEIVKLSVLTCKMQQTAFNRPAEAHSNLWHISLTSHSRTFLHNPGSNWHLFMFRQMNFTCLHTVLF